jgi:hypothetical protein
MIDVLARHADVVGDLVGLIALLGARQNAGAAETVDGRVVGVLGVDVPIVPRGASATDPEILC